MKINKWLIAVAVALGVTFGVTTGAVANHVKKQVVLGEVQSVTGSFCVGEAATVAILDELRTNGMARSVAMYEVYMGMGTCKNLPPFEAKVIRVVSQFETAAVIEVEVNGNTLYMINANIEIVEASGNPV